MVHHGDDMLEEVHGDDDGHRRRDRHIIVNLKCIGALHVEAFVLHRDFVVSETELAIRFLLL